MDCARVPLSTTAIFNLFHLMAHKLITKILLDTEKLLFADLTKNRYNFASITLEGYC